MLAKYDIKIKWVNRLISMLVLPLNLFWPERCITSKSAVAPWGALINNRGFLMFHA